MISHENYEKRSLNMESNKIVGDTIRSLSVLLGDKKAGGILTPDTKQLYLVKDYMHGEPVWRAPNKKDLQMFEEWNIYKCLKNEEKEN